MEEKALSKYFIVKKKAINCTKAPPRRTELNTCHKQTRPQRPDPPSKSLEGIVHSHGCPLPGLRPLEISEVTEGASNTFPIVNSSALAINPPLNEGEPFQETRNADKQADLNGTGFSELPG